MAFHTGSGDLKFVPCVWIGGYRLSHSPAHLVSAFHSIVFQDPQRHVEVSSPWSCTPLMAEPLRSPQSTKTRVIVYKGKAALWSRGNLPWSPDCSSQAIRSFWTILQNQNWARAYRPHLDQGDIIMPNSCPLVQFSFCLNLKHQCPEQGLGGSLDPSL